MKLKSYFITHILLKHCYRNKWKRKRKGNTTTTQIKIANTVKVQNSNSPFILSTVTSI